MRASWGGGVNLDQSAGWLGEPKSPSLGCSCLALPPRGRPQAYPPPGRLLSREYASAHTRSLAAGRRWAEAIESPLEDGFLFCGGRPRPRDRPLGRVHSSRGASPRVLPPLPASPSASTTSPPPPPPSPPPSPPPYSPLGFEVQGTATIRVGTSTAAEVFGEATVAGAKEVFVGFRRRLRARRLAVDVDHLVVCQLLATTPASEECTPSHGVTSSRKIQKARHFQLLV